MVFRIAQRIQRNHALEHATINLLGQYYPRASVVGFSGPLGFTLYTPLTAEEVVPAAQLALKRLKAGESDLRYHPNCGTNLVVTALLTTFSSWLGLRTLDGSATRRSWWQWLDSLSLVVLLNVLALLAARPLAEWVQKNVTTSAQNMSDVEITSVFTDHQGKVGRISIHTRQG